MTTAAELIPMASPDFEAGPPRENAIELARVVDRGIRESEVIEMDKLCILSGKKVWIIFIDIHILDYDGNLFDAASIASLAALLSTKIPVTIKRDNWLIDDALTNLQEKDTKVRDFMKNNRNFLQNLIQKKKSVWEYIEKNNQDIMDIIKNKYPITWDYWLYHKEDFQLPMKEPSISCSSVKYNGIVVMDPSLDEEDIAEARLTVATDNNGDIRAMQKGLNGSFNVDEIKKVIKASIDNGKKIREKLYKTVGK
jgi:exosome complex RNA-binding protein Rrp42 (RNase PH superfamily)